MDIKTIIESAQVFETLGLVGVLALTTFIFMYLYVKKMQILERRLDEMLLKISDLLENQKKAQDTFVDFLLEREKNKRDNAK